MKRFESFCVYVHFGVLVTACILMATLACKELGLLEWPDTRKSHQEEARQYAENHGNNSGPGIFVIEARGHEKTEGTGANPDNENSHPKRFRDESEKDRLDVFAQEGMWRSANYLVLLGVVTAVTSIVALLFIYKTFRAQRDELNETKSANALQLRPQLKFKCNEIRFKVAEDDAKTALFGVEILIKNTGATAVEDFNFRGLAGISYFAGRLDDVELYNISDGESVDAPIYIAPGEAAVMHLQCTLGKAEVDQFDASMFSDFALEEIALCYIRFKISVRDISTRASQLRSLTVTGRTKGWRHKKIGSSVISGGQQLQRVEWPMGDIDTSTLIFRTTRDTIA